MDLFLVVETQRLAVEAGRDGGRYWSKTQITKLENVSEMIGGICQNIFIDVVKW